MTVETKNLINELILLTNISSSSITTSDDKTEIRLYVNPYFQIEIDTLNETLFLIIQRRPYYWFSDHIEIIDYSFKSVLQTEIISMVQFYLNKTNKIINLLSNENIKQLQSIHSLLYYSKQSKDILLNMDKIIESVLNEELINPFFIDYGYFEWHNTSEKITLKFCENSLFVINETNFFTQLHDVISNLQILLKKE